MGKLFGTDGVRGIANRDLGCRLAQKLGQAGAYVLSKENRHAPRILIGKDTRISGDMLEAALIAGVCSVGATAVRAGVIPTPAIAYLTRRHGFDAGIVISASHNSFEYNGIKFFNSSGYKLRDEIEEEIEDIVLNPDYELDLPDGGGVGHMEELSGALDSYVKYAASTVDCELDGLKIALDCANGASHITSPEAFRCLGAEVLVINDAPDGTNINRGCGSTHMESLRQFVLENGCDFGFAFDGDADRVLAVDERGKLVDGDAIMAICGLELKKRGALKNNTIVATVMSNLGLFLMGEEQGINIPRTKVGDRYVLEEMLKNDYILGGEQSGHIIFLEHNTTGDGLVTALHLSCIVKRSGRTLSELSRIVRILPQVLVNAKVKKAGDTRYQNDPDLLGEIGALESKFSGKGRVLIRPSGTEPLVRVMIEGEDEREIEAEAIRIARMIEEKFKK